MRRRVLLAIAAPLAAQDEAPRYTSRFNVATYAGASIPTLQPGDVVVVPRNGFSKWKSVAGILRDLSVVASAYFLYLRTTKD